MTVPRLFFPFISLGRSQCRRFGILLWGIVLVVPAARAQFVAPAAIDLSSGSYTQDWGITTFNGFPTGFAGGISDPKFSPGDAESSDVYANATIAASPPATLTVTQGLYGYATGGNGMLAVTSKNETPGGARALVMAIDTTGFSQVDLAYDLVVASASTSQRGVGIVVQYRVGNTGGWTTMDDSFFISKSAPPAIGTTSSYNYTLAADALNQPLVEIRWQEYLEGVAGSFSSIGIDNIAVSAVPEPAAWGVLSGLIVLAGAVGRRRCRRS
jgi:hypothetical protein